MSATTSPGWAGTLLAVLAIVGLGLLVGWLDRSRTSPSLSPQAVLRYPRSVLVLGGLFTAGFPVATVVSFNTGFDGHPAVRLILVLAVLGFIAATGFGVFLILDYFITEIELVPHGLRFRLPLRGAGLVPWHDITNVSWSHMGKWFVFRLTAGRPVRVSAMLSGLPAFAATLLRRVPRQIFDEKALALLEACAAGRLPRLH